MSLSMGELEALCLKAARGAGYNWGLAEEAAKAVRWLASYDLPGPQALSAYLKMGKSATPKLNKTRLEGTQQHLCPIASGALISDLDVGFQESKIGPITSPLLIVPFIAMNCTHTKRGFRVSWNGSTIVIASNQIVNARLNDGFDLAASVMLDPADPDMESNIQKTRFQITADTKQTLENFAHKTYAPDTEQSRQTGAGAGLTDND